MQVTKEDIESRFYEYNRKYFNGVLGKCLISYLYMPGFGKYTYNPKVKGNVKSRILISKSVNWTDEALRDTVIHEMIHMYVRTVKGKRIDGLFGHGFAFRRECRRLRREHGIKITIHGFEIEHLKKDRPTGLWEKILLCIIDGGY